MNKSTWKSNRNGLLSLNVLAVAQLGEQAPSYAVNLWVSYNTVTQVPKFYRTELKGIYVICKQGTELNQSLFTCAIQ